MNVLLVGAGAVGQVYGHHLQRGGARVSFYVKEKYAEAARGGFVLYPLNRRDRTTPVRWSAYEVVTHLDEVKAGTWDQVWICVSGTALRAGWFAELVSRCTEATIVSMLPGLEDYSYVAQFVPEARIVTGLINLISYQAPLPGETRFSADGIAYWFPPLSGSPFSGPEAPVQVIVSTLMRGGQPAESGRDVRRSAAFASALMMANIGGLELAGWRFDDLRRHDALTLAHRAAREAMAIVAAVSGTSIPLALRWFGGPLTIRVLTRLAPLVIPLDIETYLEYHFTKVGDQTRLYLDSYIEGGQERDLPTASLEELRRRLPVLAS